MSNDVRVLVVNTSWGWYREEGIDIQELVEGMCATAPPGARLFGTDGHSVFEVRACEDGLELEPLGGRRTLLRLRIDVAHVHMVVRPIHLVLAILLRLRGVPVVCSPMAMLGRDFAAGVWFRGRSGLHRRLKPLKVALWRRAWSTLAQHFVCVGLEEVRQAELPRARCTLAPFPAPRSELALAADDEGGPHLTIPRSAGSVALISRYDPKRKGFDRVGRWLEANAGALPEPSVTVFAPTPEDGDELADVMRTPLVRWDPESRGADLIEPLSRCRGVVLLSRWEGQPRALREAALLGLPTISTVSCNFSEVVAVLGSGTVVDGDRPEEIQAAFVGLPAHPRAHERARIVFDRERIAAFMWTVLGAVARSEPVPSSYYDTIAEQLRDTEPAAC